MAKKIEYVTYLDKEMTIMGVLSAFSISAAGALVWKVTEAKREDLLWHMGDGAPWLTFGGSGFVLVAAFLFYRQRSLLAFYFGQIVLATNHPELAATKPEVSIRESDSWATWLFYRWAFAFLILGFVGWSGALLLSRVEHQERGWPVDSYIVATEWVLGIMVRIHFILHKHADDAEYPLDSWRAIFGCELPSSKRTPPAGAEQPGGGQEEGRAIISRQVPARE
jgi:hypothetical protein